MNPTFTKLYAAAEHVKACEPALTAIQTAANWDELCAHPRINEWAAWFTANVKEHDSLYAYYEEERIYEATHTPLYDDYITKRDLLRAELVELIRIKYEI